MTSYTPPQNLPPSRKRNLPRWLGRVSALILSGGLAVGTLVWFAKGLSPTEEQKQIQQERDALFPDAPEKRPPHPRANIKKEPQQSPRLREEEPRLVVTTLYDYEMHTPLVSLSGTTRPLMVSSVSANVSSPVQEIFVEVGDPVKEGQPLLRLEPETRLSAQTSAQAALDLAEKEYSAAKNLASSGFNSKVKETQTLSSLENARESLARINYEISQLEVRAPFDGVIASRSINPAERVNVGTELFRVFAEDPLLLEVLVPERYILSLDQDKTINLFLGSNEVATQGTIYSLTPETQTSLNSFTASIRFDNPGLGLVEGVRAVAELPLKEIQAHAVEARAFVTNSSGTLGAFVFNEEDSTAKFTPVEIITAEGNVFWVSGLPEQAQIITQGQNYVSDGDVVRVTTEGALAVKDSSIS